MLPTIQIIQLVCFALIISTGQFLFKKTVISLNTIKGSVAEPLSFLDGLLRAI